MPEQHLTDVERFTRDIIPRPTAAGGDCPLIPIALQCRRQSSRQPDGIARRRQHGTGIVD
jgi:hypothetical protein